MLSAKKIENQAKPKDKPYKLYDADGLYLHVAPSGVRSWRLDYRIAGAAKRSKSGRETLTIGKYPEVSIEQARYGTINGRLVEGFISLAQARAMIARGESPAQTKKNKKQEDKHAEKNTVRAACEAWYDGKKDGLSESWRGNNRRWLKRDIYPAIGDRPIKLVTADDLEIMLEEIRAKSGAYSAESCRQLLADVYSSLPRRLSLGNPARDLNRIKTVKGRPKGKAFPSKRIADLFAAIEGANARPQTKIAAKLLVHTFVRKNELLKAPWEEFDLERRQWIVNDKRMKAKRPHLIPLSTQVIDMLKELKSLAGGSPLILPSFSNLNKPMGQTSLNGLFRDIGFPEFTPHSARHTASTLINAGEIRKKNGFRFTSDEIELQLAHQENNRTRAAYNFADLADERREMMQAYSDYLDMLRAGENVVPIRGKAA